MRIPARSVVPATVEIGLLRQTGRKIPVQSGNRVIQYVLIGQPFFVNAIEQTEMV